jgi:hypothetical protein
MPSDHVIHFRSGYATVVESHRSARHAILPATRAPDGRGSPRRVRATWPSRRAPIRRGHVPERRIGVPPTRPQPHGDSRPGVRQPELRDLTSPGPARQVLVRRDMKRTPLRLRTETLRELTPQSLVRVAGGGAAVRTLHDTCSGDPQIISVLIGLAK